MINLPRKMTSLLTMLRMSSIEDLIKQYGNDMSRAKIIQYGCRPLSSTEKYCDSLASVIEGVWMVIAYLKHSRQRKDGQLPFVSRGCLSYYSYGKELDVLMNIIFETERRDR